jgi:oxygen-independent coproporphyrinogen-3 oxidase
VFEAGLRHHHLANTAYPIAHRRTIWHLRQPAGRHAALLRAGFKPGEPMGLYIHIPFCERRCDFCEYCVVNHHTPEVERAYHEALLGELEQYLALFGEEGRELCGLDIGGGTPSLYDPARIAELVERVTAGFRLQEGFGISIETTPKIAAEHPERLRAYRAMGIERISMGLQLINPRLLRDYGRDLNSVGHNRRAVDNIRAAGFRRFNIDLMYGFARQTEQDLARSVAYTIDLAPDYVTLYRMRYKGTRIHGESDAVPLSKVTGMYETARALLVGSGYRANPGKNGFSRLPGDPGTSEYLTARVEWGVPYLGLGLGAQTFTGDVLAYNLGAASKRLRRYLEAAAGGRLPVQDLYHLTPAEGMAKMIAVSFYFGQINRLAVRRRFGVELEQAFPEEVAFVRARGLMRSEGHCLRLTKRGVRAVNGVVALFYSPRVKQHLLSLSED